MSDDQAITLANALKISRPELGPTMPIGLYRIVRLLAMEEMVGRGASAAFYVAGKRLGESLGLTTVEDFVALCEQLSVGKITVTQPTPDSLHVDVHECVTCSGMEPVGRPLCHLEGGLISGAIKTITGKANRVREVTCIGGLGDETCGYDVTFL